jgi:integrase/recombinase XerD
MKKASDLLQVLSEYFDVYLPVTKGLSINTIYSYQYAFQILFKYLYSQKNLSPEKVSFRDLEGETIEQFLSWLETERNCSACTRNQRLAAISSFAKYAINKHFSCALTFSSTVSNIPQKKKPKKSLSYFTLEEVSVLLRIPDTITGIEKRDRVLLSVLYASGARAQELCDLTVNDIRFDTKTSLRLVGKGNKARTITIPDNCAQLLKNHLKCNKLDAETQRNHHVFSSQTHEHMTISCIECIVKKYVSKARIERPNLFPKTHYSPHSFRHSIAVHMLEAGIPLPVIKNFLGHSSIETTLIYATVSEDLANKYLRNRSFVNETVVNDEGMSSSIKSTLPFLEKVIKRK